MQPSVTHKPFSNTAAPHFLRGGSSTFSQGSPCSWRAGMSTWASEIALPAFCSLVPRSSTDQTLYLQLQMVHSRACCFIEAHPHNHVRVTVQSWSTAQDPLLPTSPAQPGMTGLIDSAWAVHPWSHDSKCSSHHQSLLPWAVCHISSAPPHLQGFHATSGESNLRSSTQGPSPSLPGPL